MIGRKAARERSENPQKNCVLRTLQAAQSSSIGKPYGVRVLLRNSVVCRKLETSGLSATMEFGIWSVLLPALCHATGEGKGKSKAEVDKFGRFNLFLVMCTK